MINAQMYSHAIAIDGPLRGLRPLQGPAAQGARATGDQLHRRRRRTSTTAAGDTRRGWRATPRSSAGRCSRSGAPGSRGLNVPKNVIRGLRPLPRRGRGRQDTGRPTPTSPAGPRDPDHDRRGSPLPPVPRLAPRPPRAWSRGPRASGTTSRLRTSGTSITGITPPSSCTTCRTRPGSSGTPRSATAWSRMQVVSKGCDHGSWSPLFPQPDRWGTKRRPALPDLALDPDPRSLLPLPAALPEPGREAGGREAGSRRAEGAPDADRPPLSYPDPGSGGPSPPAFGVPVGDDHRHPTGIRRASRRTVDERRRWCVFACTLPPPMRSTGPIKGTRPASTRASISDSSPVHGRKATSGMLL